VAEITQWEYRVITAGTFWSDPKDDQLENTLNELGVEGWEVISVVTQYGTNKYRVVAKRPLTSGTRRQRNWPG
jgi:hypothetical protein